MTTNLQRTEVPFGHQFWALSSIFQFPTIKTKKLYHVFGLFTDELPYT